MAKFKKKPPKAEAESSQKNAGEENGALGLTLGAPAKAGSGLPGSYGPRGPGRRAKDADQVPGNYPAGLGPVLRDNPTDFDSGGFKVTVIAPGKVSQEPGAESIGTPENPDV
jgi:hypothetical protein